MRAFKLRATVEQWPLAAPFRITGHTWERLDVLLVALERNGHVGRGEAAGVYYRNDTPATMIRQVEALRPKIEEGLTREALQELLPPGGARNALDCALWDLDAKVSGRPVWQLAQLEEPQPLLTTFTCGADTPGKMAAAAEALGYARAIKIKLTGEQADADRVRAVRAVRSDVWLGVDGNQGFKTRNSLEQLMPVLIEARVSLIEQPFPLGSDQLLDGLHSPIPLAADESVQSVADIGPLADRVQVINIKLDKCGGLTEALAMARVVKKLKMRVMVGNMLGTSLAMAPAYLLGQLCDVVDLDGPTFFTHDRETPVEYREGYIRCPNTLWGTAG